jgi:hypothetical protein
LKKLYDKIVQSELGESLKNAFRLSGAVRDQS